MEQQKLFNIIIQGLIVNMVVILLTELLGKLRSWQVLVARISDRKNRKIIDHIILGKIRDEPMRMFLKKTFAHWIKLFLIVIIPISRVTVYGIIEFFLHIQSKFSATHFYEYIVLCFLLGCIILIWTMTNLPDKIRGQFERYIFILVENILYLVIISIQFSKRVFSLIDGAVTIWVIFFIFLWDSVVAEKQYKNRISWAIEKIRYFILIGLSIRTFGNTIPFIHIFSFWVLITLIEYLVDTCKDDTNIVDVFLFLNNGNKLVRESIVQCYDSRVMYVTENKMYEFIDISEINHIYYELDNCWISKRDSNKSILCILKDGTQDYYQFFWCINKEWMAFSKTVGKHREVYIYHIGKIKRFCEIFNDHAS